MPNYLVLVRNPNGTIKRIKRESASKGDRVPNEVHRFDIDADTIPETTIKDKYLDWNGAKFTEVDAATKAAIDSELIAKNAPLWAAENDLILLARDRGLIAPDATAIPSNIQLLVIGYLQGLKPSNFRGYVDTSVRFRNAKEAIEYFGGTPENATWHPEVAQ